MKATITSLLVVLALAVLPSALNAQSLQTQSSSADAMTPERWAQFSEQVVKALASDHEGLQEGALRMIIQYGDNLNVKAARNDMKRIYRSSKNQPLRRMAVVAIGSLSDTWAVDYLRISATEETSPVLLKTIAAVRAEQTTRLEGEPLLVQEK